MKCMRCGTSISSGQVFCEPCLEDMKRHPIDPATPIMLPERHPLPTKTSHRKVRKPEEQLDFLKKVMFWQFIVMGALFLGLVVAVLVILQLLGVIALPVPFALLNNLMT